MKKMKFTQKVALILLFITLFGLLTGCTTPVDPTDPTVTEPTVTDPTTVTNPTTETPPRLFGGATDFTANLFAQYVGYSFSYNLEVSVSDGKVYINDILYDKVNYVDNPRVESFPTNQYWYAEENEQSADIFEQINACKKCYLLEIAETEDNTTYGKKIAVYEINGTYYFIKIGYQQVVRIHYFKPKIGG